MGTTWCTAIYGIVNNTTGDLTIADYVLSSGKWGEGETPAVTIGAGQTNGRFMKAQSRDDALVGPKGLIKYGLPDGTELNIRFSVPYNGSHTLTAATEGPRSSSYLVHTDPATGGKGKHKDGTGTITIRSR